MNYSVKKKLSILFFIIGIGMLQTEQIFASPAAPNIIKTAYQLDGEPMPVRLWGDEFIHGWETLKGHTVIKSKSGWWEYAVRDNRGRLISNGFAAGRSQPPEKLHIRPSAQAVNEVRSTQGAPALGEPYLAVPPGFSSGNTELLFIMVEFSDLSCSFTDTQMQANLFGATATGPGNLADYYKEISYGNLNLIGTVDGAGGCYTLTNSHDDYDLKQNGKDVKELVKEAVAMADAAGIDFSQYDNDSDGFVDSLGIIYAGGGPHDGCDTDNGASGGDGDELWPHSSSVAEISVDGVKVKRYIINSEITYGISDGVCDEIQTIGLFAHEYGHALGLPDLYDTDTSSSGIGIWSAMASQYLSTVNLSDTPPHFDPWSKSWEGWVTPIVKTNVNAEVNIPQAETNDYAIQLLANPGGVERGGTGEYFLIENRQQVGFDSQLPGCGVLIWHIDESQTSNKNEGHTAGSHRLVDLEEADGLGHLGAGTNSGDAGDPFPGTSNNQLWDDASNPHALLYDGTDSGMRVANFSDCAASMTANIGQPRADISVSKHDTPDPVLAGNYLSYLLNVHNFGPGVATDVVLTDILPSGVSYQTDTDSCVESPVGTLICNLEDIPVGETKSVTILVKVNSDLVAINDGPTTLTNTVSVIAEQIDDDLSNNEDTSSTVVLEQADLLISKQCKPDGFAPAGTNGTCTITVDNTGISAARNIRVTDSLVSNGLFDLLSATIVVDSNNGLLDTTGVCSPSSQNNINGNVDIICNSFDLDIGDRATVVIVVTADDEIDINDTVTVTSETPDPDINNNKATGSLQFIATADLALTKTDSPDPVVAGEKVTYTLVVTNNGPSSASNVLIEDILPAGVTIDSVAVTIGVGSCNTGVPGNAALPTSCTFDSLANGASSTMVIVVTVLPDTTGYLHNDAEVSSDTLDQNNSNNLATTSTTVNSIADLVITKTVGAPLGGLVNAGDPLSYVIRVTSNGPSTAIGAMIHDTLPAQVEYVNFNILEGSGACDLLPGAEFVCELGDFEPGAEFVVTIETKVNSDVSDGVTIDNTASIDAQTTDPENENNRDTVSINVKTLADLWLVKTGKVLTGNSSGTVEYSLKVRNDGPACSPDDSQQCGVGGPSDAQNLLVADTLPLTPKKFVFEFATLGCAYNKATHTVTCNQAVLKNEETVTFLIQGTFKGSVGDVTNTATVTSTTNDPNVSNNTDESNQTIGGGKGNKGGRP